LTSSEILHKNTKAQSSASVSIIANDMALVDQLTFERLNTNVPLVGEVCKYIISAGGKRLRPALLLLMSGALGYTHSHRIQLAAVVEFIHTATLLHDDVVDESTLRRGRSTANATFGNPASVLVGDFLYSRAFQMMVECEKIRVLSLLAEATNVIAEGEVMQLMNMHDASIDEAAYLRVIRSKTAKLFEASCRIPCVMINAAENIERACAEYGQALGTAFQVIDDVLDYEGNTQELGKNLGDDLREGKATLPLIIAMQRANASQKQLIQTAIELGGTTQLSDVVAIVHETGAMQATKDAAKNEALRALDCLKLLPPSEYKNALEGLAQDLLERKT
jgi:octaprenyl-diphosphate synthase